MEASLQHRGAMTITLKDSDVQTIRRLNAVINGTLGGKVKTPKRLRAARKSIKLAQEARRTQFATT